MQNRLAGKAEAALAPELVDDHLLLPYAVLATERTHHPHSSFTLLAELGGDLPERFSTAHGSHLDSTRPHPSTALLHGPSRMFCHRWLGVLDLAHTCSTA